MRFLFALVLLAASGCASTPAADDTRPAHVPLTEWFASTGPNAPRLAAHRSGPAPGYPENALTTLERSARLGVLLIEVDVRASADDTLLLMHDRTLDRTTTGSGNVSDTRWANIAGLRLIDNDGDTTDAVTPTLRQALRWARDRAVLQLDLKSGVGFDDILRVVRQEAMEDQVLTIVYEPDSLGAYLRRAPNMAYSVPARTPDEVRATLAQPGADASLMIGFVGVGPSYDADAVALLREAGILAIGGYFAPIARPDTVVVRFERLDIVSIDDLPGGIEGLRWARAIGVIR